MSTFLKLYAQACDFSGSLMPPYKLLERAAQRWPTKTAIIGFTQSISFAQLYEKSIQVSCFLSQKTIQPSDRVILLCENNDYYQALYYGIWQAGVIIVPLNTLLSIAELKIIIDDCDPRWIVCSDAFHTMLVTNTIYLDRLIKGFDILNNSFKYTTTVPVYNAAHTSVILYTSGTSGTPKGVMLSGKAVMTNVLQMLSCTQYVTHEDIILSVIPLFHSFAQNSIVWSALFLGASSIMLPRIERASLLKAFEYTPSLLIGVPSFFGLLCLLKKVDLSKVKLCISGGDALSTKIKRGFELIYGRKICNGYGLTEAGPFVAAYVEEYYEGQSSVGKLAHGIEGRLIDENGTILNHSSIGMLQIKGDNIMNGYYKAPELTQEVLNNGWLSTGDLATFDQYNYLYIVGRTKDLVISKGINIYPQQIENVLMNHSLVNSAALVGIPDEDDGQIGVAFITLSQHNQDQSLIKQQLYAHCAIHLAAYKIPKHIIILESLPVNTVQKINKNLLRDNFLNNIYPL